MSTTNRFDPGAEWLEADGLGGFASGTVSGIRTRRYHALLLTAATPPTGRVVLVNGFDATVETPQGTFAISSQRYAPDVIHPDGASRIESFSSEPWPRWHFRLTSELLMVQELFVRPGESAVYLSWHLQGKSKATLRVRPFFSGRDFHSTHHENSSFRFAAEEKGEEITWQVYPDLPAIVARSNGRYTRQPDWYRNFLYSEEQARGLDASEDLVAPGLFEFDLSEKNAVLLLAAAGHAKLDFAEPIECRLAEVRASERQRRKKFPTPLHRAADAYLVRRGRGQTIIAGYPWFCDWGRDTFIALRGLCIASGRLQDAHNILLEWAGLISEGMLPNRFPDQGDQPEFNSVDASLWYIIAVGDYLRAVEKKSGLTSRHTGEKLRAAVAEILTGYDRGTRFGICADEDGLLRAGAPGYQLTWMDARVDGREITPRIGKPVEIQALWLNALAVGAQFSDRWRPILERGRASFATRFWNPDGEYLYDVVDCDHQAGALDSSFRPNQIFAVGGLPLILLPDEQARKVVNAVEARLLTPLGLRTLAPDDPNYIGHCRGGVAERDRAYHQGTDWPWLLGPFIEAWVRVRGHSPEAKNEATSRFIMPLIEHLQHAGLGHISEIAEGDPPHTPAGCPFQAWSLGELLRLDSIL
ncbi:MAG: amylo-alpha-1,6-glucosidase [Chthoniobacterales bacterium]